MTTISEHFNSQAFDIAFDNTLMIPVWILLILQVCEARDKRKVKRLADQQRGFYRTEVKQQRQRYERQIQPQYRVTSPHF